MSSKERARKTESTANSARDAVQRSSSEEALSARLVRRTRSNPQSLTSSEVVQLQRTIGNRAVSDLVQRHGDNDGVNKEKGQFCTIKLFVGD